MKLSSVLSIYAFCGFGIYESIANPCILSFIVLPICVVFAGITTAGLLMKETK